MSKPVVILKDAVVIDRAPDEVFELFADPAALMKALNVDGATARKLGNAQRWVMSHPDKLGDRVVDLSLAQHNAPDHLVWQATIRGFEIETEIKFTPEAEASTRLRLASKVRAETLRARLMAPILKLGKGRLQKGLRKGLKQISNKLRTT